MPATPDDCAGFTGYKKKEVLKLIEQFNLQLKSVRCEGVAYFDLHELEGDAEIPRCIFLSGFDQIILGYKDRSRLMGFRDKEKVVTGTGIVFPTILIVTSFHRLLKSYQKLIQNKAEAVFSEDIDSIVFAD